MPRIRSSRDPFASNDTGRLKNEEGSFANILSGCGLLKGGYDSEMTTTGTQSLQLHRRRVNEYESLDLYNIQLLPRLAHILRLQLDKAPGHDI